MAPTLIEPRSAQACAETLRLFRGHRAAHPLPSGWLEDASGLEDAADDLAQEVEPIPYLAFDGPRTQGELSVDVELYHPTQATVCVTDIGEDGLTPESLAELLHVLLGIAIDPAAVGEPDLIREAGDCTTVEPAGTAFPGDAASLASPWPVIGRSWSLSLPFPSPSDSRPCSKGGTCS